MSNCKAMKRQAGRPSKDNSSPVGIDLRGKQSLDLMSEECGDSRNQIHRYIRLTNLVPELLDYQSRTVRYFCRRWQWQTANPKTLSW